LPTQPGQPPRGAAEQGRAGLLIALAELIDPALDLDGIAAHPRPAPRIESGSNSTLATTGTTRHLLCGRGCGEAPIQARGSNGRENWNKAVVRSMRVTASVHSSATRSRSEKNGVSRQSLRA